MKITLELTEEQQNEIVRNFLLLLPDKEKGEDKVYMREKALLLREKKLSLREISKVLGISHQTVSNWLSEDLTNNRDE